MTPQLATTETTAAARAWGVPDWQDRTLPPGYGQHARPRGETARIIADAWAEGIRSTKELAERAGVTRSCVSAHKARLGLPKVRHGNGTWKGTQ